MDEGRPSLRIVGAAPPSPDHHFPLYSREVRRHLRAIQCLSPAERAELEQALATISLNAQSVRAIARAAHLQAQIDSTDHE